MLEGVVAVGERTYADVFDIGVGAIKGLDGRNGKRVVANRLERRGEAYLVQHTATVKSRRTDLLCALGDGKALKRVALLKRHAVYDLELLGQRNVFEQIAKRKGGIRDGLQVGRQLDGGKLVCRAKHVDAELCHGVWQADRIDPLEVHERAVIHTLQALVEGERTAVIAKVAIMAVGRYGKGICPQRLNRIRHNVALLAACLRVSHKRRGVFAKEDTVLLAKAGVFRIDTKAGEIRVKERSLTYAFDARRNADVAELRHPEALLADVLQLRRTLELDAAQRALHEGLLA